MTFSRRGKKLNYYYKLLKPGLPILSVPLNETHDSTVAMNAFRRARVRVIPAVSVILDDSTLGLPGINPLKSCQAQILSFWMNVQKFLVSLAKHNRSNPFWQQGVLLPLYLINANDYNLGLRYQNGGAASLAGGNASIFGTFLCPSVQHNDREVADIHACIVFHDNIHFFRSCTTHNR